MLSMSANIISRVRVQEPSQQTEGFLVQGIDQLVTSNKKLEELVTSNKLTSLEIKQRALIIADGLTSTESPNDMTGWYCQAFKKLGESRYSAVASAARSGNKPKQLFGWLLKREMMSR